MLSTTKDFLIKYSVPFAYSEEVGDFNGDVIPVGSCDGDVSDFLILHEAIHWLIGEDWQKKEPNFGFITLHFNELYLRLCPPSKIAERYFEEESRKFRITYRQQAQQEITVLVLENILSVEYNRMERIHPNTAALLTYSTLEERCKSVLDKMIGKKQIPTKTCLTCGYFEHLDRLDPKDKDIVCPHCKQITII